MKKWFLKKIYGRILNRIFNPFFGINLKPMPFQLKETDKCLVIAPHPDDESIGCGGILNLYPDNFDVISLTAPSEERKNEFKSAMEFANIKNYKMLNLEDKHISEGYEKFKEINISEYDYIFIPYVFDQHKDHKAVSLLLEKHIKNSKHKNDLKIAYYEVWSAMSMPQYYINITKAAKKKADMINLHKSQIATKDYAQKILGLNSYRGLLKSIDYVESFSILTIKEFTEVMKNLKYDE